MPTLHTSHVLLLGWRAHQCETTATRDIMNHR